MTTFDEQCMRRAQELAVRGQGYVEPNPLVGCVIAQRGAIVAEGWHRGFGEAHAEVEALRHAGSAARGATTFVTLEPCCHHGKTPPCTEALIEAGVARVVVAQVDPFDEVSGRGIAALRSAGIEVEVGLLEEEARSRNAPYLKLLRTGRPWIIAKWAMTLDGKIATATGDSRWVSGPASRQIVHQLRGRVDAILVGSGTAMADDPLLTARPPGPRKATRIVFDGAAQLAPDSQLVGTCLEAPVLVAVGPQASDERVATLRQRGCEVLRCLGPSHSQRLEQLLDELGRRRMTNVLVEGGGRMFGLLLDARQIDEVHALVAPKLIGGQGPGPIAGVGLPKMGQAIELADRQWEQVGDDLYLHGRVPWRP